MSFEGEIRAQMSRIAYKIRQQAQGAESTTWEYLVANWSSTPTVFGEKNDGIIYTYIKDGSTYYRFVPNTYDPTQDAFYASRNDETGELENLITTRG